MKINSVKSKIKRVVKKAIKTLIQNFGNNNSLRIQESNLEFELNSTIPIKQSTKSKMMLIWPFIAIGGAEEIVLNIVKNPIINNEFDFVHVCLYEPSESLGDLSGAFEKLSCAFYKSENFQEQHNILDKIKYLIKLHHIEVLFIPNGTILFYDSVQYLKDAFPNLRIVNQVFDHQEGWIRHYETLAIKSVDCHVAPNSSIKQAYIKYGTPAERIPLIYHGIELQSFNRQDYSSVSVTELKKALNLPLNKIIVTFAARMHPQKRPMDFLEIAKHFAEDSRFHFLMVGNGELSDKLESEIEYSKLTNITKLGFQRPIQNIYLCTDIITITSAYEGLPLVLLESLSMGIPVVATDVGAIAEVIENEVNGFVINKVGDLDSFYQSIENIANNLEKYQVNCQKMRDGLSKEFSVETMCQRYLSAFKG